MCSSIPKAVMRIVGGVAFAAMIAGNCVAQMRTWTDVTGRHSIKAVLLSVNHEAVRLGDSDGKTTIVPLRRLSEKNRQYAEEHWANLALSKTAYNIGLKSVAKSAEAQFRKGAMLGHAGCMVRLGLMHVANRNYREAQKLFMNAVAVTKDRQRFVAENRYTYVSALNNVALTQLRLASFSAGISSFRRIDGVLRDTPPEVSHNLNVLALVFAGQPRWDKAIETLLAEISPPIETRKFDASHGWIYMYESPMGMVTPKVEEEAERIEPFIPAQVESLQRFSTGTGFQVAPGLVMTNAHVVEIDKRINAHRFHVHTCTNLDSRRNRPLVATEVLAKDTGLDLALLLVPELNQKPLVLSSIDSHLGENICVMGFPQTLQFGASITTTFGNVAKRPTPQTKGRYVLDAKANPGNSGGPVFNAKGHVIGILQGKQMGVSDALSLVLNDAYALAIRAQDGRAFVKKASPAVMLAQAADTTDMKFEDLIKEIKHSTFLIESLVDKTWLRGYQRTLSSTPRVEDTALSWNGIHDRTCMTCDGRRRVRCTNRKCAGGVVKSKRSQIIPVPGTHGGKALHESIVRSRCPVCSGTNYLRCPTCRGNGIDFRLAPSGLSGRVR